MTLLEFLIILSILVTLTVLRFGIPMLVMWLGRQICCRFHLQL